MPSVLFVFFGWGYWAMRHQSQAPMHTMVATLCLFAFLGGLFWIWVAGMTAMGVCMTTLMIYWCFGAQLWTQLLSERRSMYPGLVLENPDQ